LSFNDKTYAYEIFVSITILALTAFTPASGPLPIGRPFQSRYKNEGYQRQLVSAQRSQRRQWLLVMFTCNTCPYVIKNQARTKRYLPLRHHNKLGVVLLNSNEGGRRRAYSYTDMQALCEKKGIRLVLCAGQRHYLPMPLRYPHPRCFLFG